MTARQNWFVEHLKNNTFNIIAAALIGVGWYVKVETHNAVVDTNQATMFKTIGSMNDKLDNMSEKQDQQGTDIAVLKTIVSQKTGVIFVTERSINGRITTQHTTR